MPECHRVNILDHILNICSAGLQRTWLATGDLKLETAWLMPVAMVYNAGIMQDVVELDG